MRDNTATIGELRRLVGGFVAERGWEQFHSLKNLSMSIAIEASELMEIFQWVDNGAVSERQMEKTREELADVVIYCLSLANAANIDLADAVEKKVRINAIKYPVEKFKGKYE